ncbi:MAG: tetratricopeptide repeat protein [Acidobacteriota bacterium]
MTTPRQFRWAAAALVLTFASTLTGHGAQSPVKGLTSPDGLAKAYDLVYNADFEAAETELTRACGPAPREACDVVRAASLWWRLYLDLDNHSLDQTFNTSIEQTILGCERWTVRDPQRAEAWFYLGAAYGARVQYHAQRDEYLAAARDGKRVKGALEKTLSLDPLIQDANFGIGMYEYYADAAPAALKFLRWLLLLPGGDKVKGLRQMVQAGTQGVLLKSEAAYQLHFVYLWYEKNPEGALALLEQLRTRYPGNPMFRLNLAQVHEGYLGDRLAALTIYLELIAAARGGTLAEAELGETWGRLGAAEQFSALAEADRAVEQLRPIVERKPVKPYGAVARAHLGLGQAYDRLGERAKAVAEYRAAQASAPADDPRGIRKAALDAQTRTPDARAADADRLSLEGWREFERGAISEAIARLDRAVAISPGDGVHRYRRGRALEASGDRPRALADYQRAIQARPAPPAPMLAAACVGSGRLYDAAGDRERALSSYQWAARVRGADAATRDAAALALARLRR